MDWLTKTIQNYFPTIKQTYLTQEQKGKLAVIYQKEKNRQNARSLKPSAYNKLSYDQFDLVQDLVNSLKNNINDTQSKLADPNIQSARKEQLSKQLQVKRRNLSLVQKLKPKGKKQDYAEW